ncbi:MAG: hypothetical protein JJW01_03185 [Alphaproteobacteria bacterium]|nr:hypothetical protein [Rickettsiales bacterium]
MKYIGIFTLSLFVLFSASSVHAKCYTDITGQEICIIDGVSDVASKRNSDYKKAEHGDKSTQKRRHDNNNYNEQKHKEHNQSNVQKGSESMYVNYNTIPNANKDDVEKVFGSIGVIDKKTHGKVVKPSERETALLARDIEKLEKSIVEGIDRLNKNGISLKKIRKALIYENVNNRKKYDLALFGLFGMLPSSSMFQFAVLDAAYSSVIDNSTFNSSSVKEIGAGFKLNLGSDRISFFLNSNFKGMFDTSISDSVFSARGQIGISYALATTAKKGFILSGLIGVESMYKGMNPSVFGSGAELSELDAMKDQIDKEMIKENPDYTIIDYLKEKHTILEREYKAKSGTKLFSTGLMLGLKFTEYAGDKNIFSQGIHVSAGPALLSQYNTFSGSDVGLALNVGAFFEHSIKVSDATYFRWFVDVEALSYLAMTPKLPFSMSAIENALISVKEYLETVQEAMDSQGSVGKFLNAIPMFSSLIINAFEDLTNKITDSLNGNVNGSLKDLLDAIDNINFGDSDGVLGIIKMLDDLITVLKSGVSGIPDELITLIQDCINPIIKLLTGFGSGDAVSDEIWKITMEDYANSSLENLLINEIEKEYEIIASAKIPISEINEIRAIIRDAINGVAGAQDALVLKLDSLGLNGSDIYSDISQNTQYFIDLASSLANVINDIINGIPNHDSAGIVSPAIKQELKELLEDIELAYESISQGDFLSSITDSVSDLSDGAADLLNSILGADFMQQGYRLSASFIPKVDFGIGLYWKI